MSRILVFAAGMLFGLAVAMYFGLGNRSEPASEQAAVNPPTQAPVAVPSQDSPTPPIAEESGAESPAAVKPEPEVAAPAQGLTTPDIRADELKAEVIQAQELPSVPPPVVPEPQPPQPPPAIPPEPPATLLIPVEGIEAGQLKDTFSESRSGGRIHDAIDILAPRGALVFAVDDGKVVKLFKSKPGGLTVYQFDPTEKFAYYYAHLDAYASGVVEGKNIKRGDLIGFVGSTGNAIASAPHLHFAIFVLGAKKRWWEGTAINPYPLLGGVQENMDD